MVSFVAPYALMLAFSLNSGDVTTSSNEYVDKAGPIQLVAGEKTATFVADRMPKWRDTSQRYHTEQFIQGIGGGVSTWADWIRQSRSVEHDKRVEWINRKVNSIRYIPDKENWGVNDYWATPAEFLQRGGDCEDYAIAKYRLMVASGVPADSMAIAVLKNHAVLIVNTELDMIVLDNLKTSPYRIKKNMLNNIIFTVNDYAWVIQLG